jgi:hypothetical protein
VFATACHPPEHTANEWFAAFSFAAQEVAVHEVSVPEASCPALLVVPAAHATHV